VAELTDPSGDEQSLCLPVNLNLIQERQVQKTWVTEDKESKGYNKEAAQSSISP